MSKRRDKPVTLGSALQGLPVEVASLPVFDGRDQNERCVQARAYVSERFVVDDDERPVIARISGPEVDSYRSFIDPRGLDTSWIYDLGNRITLHVNHDRSMVAGSLARVWTEPDGWVMAELDFADTTTGVEYESLVRGGHVGGLSIRFIDPEIVSRSDKEWSKYAAGIKMRYGVDLSNADYAIKTCRVMGVSLVGSSQSNAGSVVTQRMVDEMVDEMEVQGAQWDDLHTAWERLMEQMSALNKRVAALEYSRDTRPPVVVAHDGRPEVIRQ